MKQIRRNGHWVIALAGAVCLAWAAGVMAQRGPALSGPAVAEQGSSTAGVVDAHNLSAAFRQVAKSALPAIVSIEVRGKAAKMQEVGGDSEDSPFGDLFKSDPRLKEFFKNRQRGSSQPRSHGMGSGFIIDPAGIILTNNHVVQDADQVKVKLSDGREFVANDVKTDPRSDVAIVRISPNGKLPHLKMGSSEATEIGDWVLAVGSPFGLDLTVTAGIISAKGRGPGIAEREDFLQTDAAINPGNSGGPLLNLHGEVVGINTAISTRSGGYEGIGFAVPIDMARWVADQLIGKGNVSRGYLGIAMQPVDSEIATQLNVPVGRGALVTQIVPKSPAADAKLEPGDLVLKLNGREVHGPRSLQGIVEQLKIGETYKMDLLRNGKDLTVNIQINAMPKEYSMSQLKNAEEPAQPQAAPRSFDELGLGVEEVTPEVARQLGFKQASGVLISSVKEDSPAANAGLREGMLIEKVAGKTVNSPAEFKEALKGASVEKGVLLLVRTTRGAQFVVVKQAHPAAAK